MNGTECFGVRRLDKLKPGFYWKLASGMKLGALVFEDQLYDDFGKGGSSHGINNVPDSIKYGCSFKPIKPNPKLWSETVPYGEEGFFWMFGRYKECDTHSDRLALCVGNCGDFDVMWEDGNFDTCVSTEDMIAKWQIAK